MKKLPKNVLDKMKNGVVQNMMINLPHSIGMKHSLIIMRGLDECML